MKRILLLVISIFLLYGMICCSSDDDVYGSKDCSWKLEVLGTQGTPFDGSIGVDGASRSIEGTIPETYQVGTGDVCACVLQKDTNNSNLMILRLYRNNSFIVEERTTAGYGVVTVSGSCY